MDEVLKDSWFGRSGPIPWLPRSPDLTPIDFFLWGHVKQLVNATTPATEASKNR